MLLLLFIQFTAMWCSENGVKKGVRYHPNKFTERLLGSTNMYIKKADSNWVEILINSIKQNLICNMSTWGFYGKTQRKF